MAGEKFYIYWFMVMIHAKKLVIKILNLVIEKIFYRNSRKNNILKSEELTFIKYKGGAYKINRLFQKRILNTLFPHYLIFFGFWPLLSFCSGSHLFDSGSSLHKDIGNLTFFRFRITLPDFYTFLFRLNPF